MSKKNNGLFCLKQHCDCNFANQCRYCNAPQNKCGTQSKLEKCFKCKVIKCIHPKKDITSSF